MTEQKKTKPIECVRNIESVRLANLFIRIAWKVTFGLLTLFARLITAIVLMAVRFRLRRNRYFR